mmetsp:Transcript_87841/g.209927  ORF Transcript_87841/g.209927 Transcript_87841/m.209927 type:complete len:162 (+) Transcript_87841:78-563(+)
MPYGGRRRRSEWDHGSQWQWRQANDGRRHSSRRDFDVHRGEDLLNKYRMAGEELYNYAYGAQVPEFPGVPATMTVCTERPLAAACNAMNTMTPSSNQMMLMCDGIGWGGFNAPEAAPALPLPISSDVQCILDNMLRLQHMGPEQAAQILKDTAAVQGAYED